MVHKYTIWDATIVFRNESDHIHCNTFDYHLIQLNGQLMLINMEYTYRSWSGWILCLEKNSKLVIYAFYFSYFLHDT